VDDHSHKLQLNIIDILLSDPILFIFVSYDQITLVQSPTVQSLYLRANSGLLLLYCRKESFLFFATAFKNVALRTVWTEIEEARPELIR